MWLIGKKVKVKEQCLRKCKDANVVGFLSKNIGTITGYCEETLYFEVTFPDGSKYDFRLKEVEIIEE